MNKFKLTFFGLVLSFAIYFFTVLIEQDLFEKFVTFLASLESFEFDEIIIPFLVFVVFFFIDTIKNALNTRVENEKKSVYKAMLSSSHHILNNFISQMNIFKITAEDTPGFDIMVLSYYDDIINMASKQINSLSNLKTIDEFSIKTSIMKR